MRMSRVAVIVATCGLLWCPRELARQNLLITNADPKILSATIPSKLEEVEAAMARLKKQVKSTPLP